MASSTPTESILSQWRAIVICLIAAMGAFQFGYDTSYFSGTSRLLFICISPYII